MGARKKDDTSPRKAKVRQVCMTPVKAQMLDAVAEKLYGGRVSHAMLDLLDRPLTEAYEELVGMPKGPVKSRQVIP
tara:strand:+ start:426 stop:653 length:228 start_codon:yes stop_codon:yes gene_type:complete